MPIWNSAEIANDLRHIVGVVNINNAGVGGDWDTDNLVIVLAGTDDQNLFVRGFDPEQRDSYPDSGNVEVTMVELSDRLSSDGGLNSHDFRVARAYIDVRQYFINRGFDVVLSMRAYY